MRMIFFVILSLMVAPVFGQSSSKEKQRQMLLRLVVHNQLGKVSKPAISAFMTFENKDSNKLAKMHFLLHVVKASHAYINFFAEQGEVQKALKKKYSGDIMWTGIAVIQHMDDYKAVQFEGTQLHLKRILAVHTTVDDNQQVKALYQATLKLIDSPDEQQLLIGYKALEKDLRRYANQYADGLLKAKKHITLIKERELAIYKIKVLLAEPIAQNSEDAKIFLEKLLDLFNQMKGVKA